MLTITFASTASVEFSEQDFAVQLASMKSRNENLAITGLLIYRSGRFIHVLEGPDEAVRTLYASYLADPRHRDTQLLADNSITERNFTSWTVNYQPQAGPSTHQLAEFDQFFDALAGDTSLPDNVRRSEALFDWLSTFWLTPAAESVSPSLLAVADPLPPTPTPTPTLRRASEQQLDRTTSTLSSNSTRAQAKAIASTPAGSSIVVTAIYDKIMAEVQTGVLQSGDILKDRDIAERFGISRTPVREALQLLRISGVVQSSANSFTRVAVIDAKQAGESITVLAALYRAVLEEVIGRVSAEVIEGMREDREAFLHNVLIGDPSSTARSSASFYLRLVNESDNPALKNIIHSMVHIMVLAGPQLEKTIGKGMISTSQDALLSATIAGDLARAYRAIEMLTGSQCCPLAPVGELAGATG